VWQRRGEGKGEEGDVLLCRLRNWVVWVVRGGGWVGGLLLTTGVVTMGCCSGHKFT
jgi:hypothetical protein